MKRTGAVLAVALCLAGLPMSAGAAVPAGAAEPGGDEVGWATVASLGRSGSTPVSTAQAAAAAGSFEETPCSAAPEADPGLRGVRCGYVTVPEDHGDPGGRTIRLAIAAP